MIGYLFMLKWGNRNGFTRGIIFFMLMMGVSCSNDVIVKSVGQRLPAAEVIFFRFFFSLIVLLPCLFKYGVEVLRTSHLLNNVVRGAFGVISFYLYTYSLVALKIVEVVTILWTIPLFTLVFAFFILRERVTLQRWIATLIGFVGLLAISLFGSDCSLDLKLIYIIPIASSMLFAAQDVLIKEIVAKENRITMLLYFAMVCTALTFVPALCVWETPTPRETMLLVLSGVFANLIQYFLFKAFEATDLSALAPFRYMEFLFSALFGFIFFTEIPGMNVIIGAIVLIPSTLYLSYTESKRKS